MSCYALFKGWLLLSQPTCCIGNQTAFSLKNHFRTLDESLGCFPLAEIRLSGLDSLPSNKLHVLGVWLIPIEINLSGPSSSSTPCNVNWRLYLNISRGEPAISVFDWHITPNHKSSHVISPTTRSDLLSPFRETHPAHG